MSFVGVVVTARLTRVGVPGMTGRMVSFESVLVVFCKSVAVLPAFCPFRCCCCCLIICSACRRKSAARFTSRFLRASSSACCLSRRRFRSISTLSQYCRISHRSNVSYSKLEYYNKYYLSQNLSCHLVQFISFILHTSNKYHVTGKQIIKRILVYKRIQIWQPLTSILQNCILESEDGMSSYK